ncbi:MAG: hypothetical protein AVDCRST_MAG33-2041, partial [uncultured Thermomicrobiales bacterium]
ADAADAAELQQQPEQPCRQHRCNSGGGDESTVVHYPGSVFSDHRLVVVGVLDRSRLLPRPHDHWAGCGAVDVPPGQRRTDPAAPQL